MLPHLRGCEYQHFPHGRGQHSAPHNPHIPTVTPPPSQTCNLTIAPSGNKDPYYAELLPHKFANTVMDPTTGMEARISDLLAGRVEGQDRPTWSEATCREFGRLMQGYREVKGTNTMFVIHRR